MRKVVSSPLKQEVTHRDIYRMIALTSGGNISPPYTRYMIQSLYVWASNRYYNLNAVPILSFNPFTTAEFIPDLTASSIPLMCIFMIFPFFTPTLEGCLFFYSSGFCLSLLFSSSSLSTIFFKFS